LDKAVLRLAANETAPQNLPPALAKTIPHIPGIQSGKSMAVICAGFSCQPPWFEVDELKRALQGIPKTGA
jgi:uncharacterized protein